MKKTKLFILALLATFSVGQVWGTDLTAHTPGVYEKTVATGGYGIDLTTYSGDKYEVYYFSANSKYGNVCTGATAAQYRLMAADSDSEHILFANSANTAPYSESCDWIEMDFQTTGFAKSDYTYSSSYNEFFAIAPNGGNTSYTKTCYIKPKNGDVLTLKVSGYEEFAILAADNGSSKYMTITVDGGTPTSWKSNTLSRRAVSLTTGEHTIVVANEGTSANNFYGFSLKLPSCSTEITTQPSGANLAIGDANPELSIVATNADSYAWKESSDGTSYDGTSTLGTESSYTPSVNNAVQTKYYYCEVTSSCDGTTVVKSNIVTVNIVASITYYTVTLVPDGGTISDATGWTLNGGNYEKTVADGTELALPTFTKADRTFKTWRKSGPTDVASPVTVNSDLTLTAIWTVGVDNIIYSWEGAESGAIEVGGTAAGSIDGYINIVSAGYYCLKIEGGTSYDKYVEITLSGTEKVKTGDKIIYWGFYNKSSSANARPKMRDGNSPNAEIFNDGTNLPNLYSGGEPAKREFTVPADINTNKVQITRSQTGSNTWISKLQIIRAVQIEEGDMFTVTLNYNDGGITPNSSILVASGQTVTKPADPTWAHHRFNCWKLSGSEYNFSTPVTANITLVADWTQLYTVTYAAGDGSGDAPTAVDDKATGETFSVAANTFTAPENKEFDKWNDGTNDYAPGDTYTVGSANVVLTAQWKALVAKYTVIFKDGETELGTKSVDVGSNPTDAGIDKTKPHYTFAAWQLSGSDITLNDASWASVAENAEITLTARWTENDKLVVTFMNDGAQYGATQNIYIEDATTVSGVDSPTKAGNIFKGWYDGETKYNFATTITTAGTLTLTAKWEAADANHFEYAYNDDFHYDGVSYKTPEGKVDNGNGGSNIALSNASYSLFAGTGITSVVANNAIYDSKSNWVNAYLKINTGGTSNLVITIASNYTATLAMKMGGYSSNPTVTLKDAGDNTIDPTSGTIGGVASKENDFKEITYSLSAGTYTMTTATKTLYISHIDLEAEYVNPTALDDVENKVAPRKVIENGHVFILKDGIRYNVLGNVVK